ncbi:eukaryotic translation initiation factor 2D [Hetaerina americana]|uniref:eukaryotic translation initiation factor 2D n=1 Tax=Hetaerina americana TaxID=62018 RepID=UPI003A7F1B61
MFRKQFKIKSHSQVKGSERKKIRSEIGEHFCQLTDEDLNNLFPNKESITTMKIVTHCGQSVVVYAVDKIPVVFEVEKVMYPTVYMLWKFPDLLHTFTTHPEVFAKLVGGADLMLPGVVLEEPYTIKSFGNVKKGDLVSVNLSDNRAPVAVGTAALSSFDMYMSAKRGKGVHIVHYNWDFLCANIKMNPPNLGPPPIIRSLYSCEEKLQMDPSLMYAGGDNIMIGSNALQDIIAPKLDEIGFESESVENERVEHCNSEIGGELSSRESVLMSLEELEIGDEMGTSEPKNDSDLRHVSENSGVEMDAIAMQSSKDDLAVINSDCENSGISVQGSMDRLLEYCLLKALKTSAKKLSLPLLTSNFFKLHMITACPKGESLDVKKSSYKKVSKFLKEIEEKGVIEIRELSKGVESIVGVNYSNPLLKTFVEDSDDDDEGLLDSSSAKSTEVNEMFVINASTLPLFKTFGYKKGESLMATSIRHHLTEYVMKNGLQSSNDKRFVKLDHTLSSCLRLKENEDITWKELVTTCKEQMGNSYSIGQSGSVNKGKLKPIEITVATRTGNKKVTLIGNLEAYGIDSTEFVKKCQHGVAASATITQVPGSKSAQVMVQGNQVIFLEKLLTGEYQIHKRFIRGLENAPKMKKSRRVINK